MHIRTLNVAPDGTQLKEIPPPKGAEYVGSFYKVFGPNEPKELYAGSHLELAEEAFRKALTNN